MLILSETKHVKMIGKIDENNSIALGKDELQELFSDLIGKVMKSVSDGDIIQAFDNALTEWNR